jgi:putative oxidoreductase
MAVEDRTVTSDAGRTAEPKLLLPFLKPSYDRAIPLSWLVLRIGCGWVLLVHGWGKVTRGPSDYVKGFAALGFEPALLWVWAALIIEFGGGLAIILGLFTRFFAAAVAIEMLMITVIYWNNGFSWLNRGYEFVLLWGIVAFAIALRGGGPYSLDRKLGVEL